MSRAAKRRARRLIREREMVARFIVDALWCEACSGGGWVPDDIGEGDGPDCLACAVRGPRGDCEECDSYGTLRECPDCKGDGSPVLQDVLDGEPFDVVVVRAKAEALLGLADDQTVFEDWCRERGHGPESSAAGWPGRLAREYAWTDCTACDGRGVHWIADCELSDLYAENLGCADGWHVMDCVADTKAKCTACSGRGRTRIHGRDPRAPMGRRLAEVGRVVLRWLDGQPSECQGSSACLVWRATGQDAWPGCPDCRGTGRNLSAQLPAIALGEHDRAALLASFGDGDHWPDWAAEVGIERASDTPPPRTNVRGEHRDPGVYARPSFLVTLEPSERPTLDERITSRTVHHHAVDRLPRWLRGEIRHTNQRPARSRACRRCRDLGVERGGYCPACVQPLAMRTPWTQDFAHEVVIARAGMAPHLSLDRFADIVATYGLQPLRDSLAGERLRLDQLGVTLNDD